MHGILQSSACVTPYIQPQIPIADHYHLYYHHLISSGKMEILSTGCSQLKMWIPTFTLNKWQQTSRVKDISVTSISHFHSHFFCLNVTWSQFHNFTKSIYSCTSLKHMFSFIFWSIFMIFQKIWIQCQIGLFNLTCYTYFYWTQHKEGKYFVKHLTITGVQTENAKYVITKL